MTTVLKQLEDIIVVEKGALERGETVTVMFDDGIATLVKENDRVAAFAEEIPENLRIFGSLTDLKKG